MLRSTFYLAKTDQHGDKVLDVLSPTWARIAEALKTIPTKVIIVDDSMVANLPAISWDQYGSVDYWWIIAQVNNIIDPMSEVVSGKKLKIPSLSDIQAILQSNPQKSSESSSSSSGGNKTAKFTRRRP